MGWITITALPSRLVDGEMTAVDRDELWQLLSLNGPAHQQGVMIGTRDSDRREYVARSQGLPFTPAPAPDWD